MSYFGDSSSNDPFGAGGPSSFNSFLPPEKPKRSNKALIIAISSLGGVLVLAGIAAGVSFAVSHFGPAAGSSASAGKKGGPAQSSSGQDSGLSSNTGDDSLNALNAAGALSWSEDTFGYVGNNQPLVTYLSDMGTDGSSCGLWLYDSESAALAASTSGDFDSMAGGITWGSSNDGSVGYVLVADSQETECATQAFNFLGLN